MRSVLVFLFLFPLLWGNSALGHTARVIEVVPGTVPFVKLDNGEVQFLEGKSLPYVGQVVETDTEGFTLEDSNYIPSVLGHQGQAVTIFEQMRGRSRRRSECYNRAHVWAYEEFNRRGTKLLKSFIFFTNRYIRNYRYKWWFHVAPLTLVGEGADQKELVLDWTFFDKPEEINDWAKYFVRSGEACPTVHKYSDYANNQEAHDCYFIKTSMYFWQPMDIEAYEKTGFEKTEFISSEIRHAYKQAFK